MFILPVKALLLIGILRLEFVATQPKKIARCTVPEVVNAKLSCSTQETAQKYIDATHCKIYCIENHEYVRGPKAIDCYRGLWLHAGRDHVPYTSPTLCERTSTGDGRSSRIAPPVQHDGMCSTDFCDMRYYGITKRKCKEYRCCWNEKKNDCFEFLKSQCQIAVAERTKCSGTWYGIHKRLCESKGCCFDGDTTTCYTAKSAKILEPTGKKPEPKEKTKPGSVSGCENLDNSLLNGRLDCKKTGAVLVCDADCDKHYVLEGVRTRSCHITSQEWSPGSWKCIRKYCEDIETLLKTFVDCTSGFRIGSTCTASCPRGFKLFSPIKNKATCLPHGEWSAPTFWQCREIQCPELLTNNIIETGTESFDGLRASISCTKGRKYGSVCAVNCPLGFLSVGVSSIRCNIDGAWTNGHFQCVALSCPPPAAPYGAYFTCTDGHKVGTTCTVKCPMGFKVSGAPSTTCRANQKWSYNPSQIRCEVSRECGEPFVPEGAQLECTDGNNVGTLCSLKCPPGKLLRGHNVNVLTCMDNLTWQLSFDGESCEGPPRCGDLQSVYPKSEWNKFSAVCSGGDLLGSVCTIECGIHGAESVVTTCTYDENEMLSWTNPPPAQCIDIATKPCDLEIDLSNGKISSQTDYSRFVKVVKTPALPLWRLWSETRHNCEYQSVIEVQYEKLTGVALRLKYDVPSTVHFQMSGSKVSNTVTGRNFNLDGIKGFSGKGIFQSKSELSFVLKKSTTSTSYKVGVANKKEMPLDFNSSPSITISLNRAVTIRHDYDIGQMGSGMCSFCLAYSDF